jgi:hypothetical protein
VMRFITVSPFDEALNSNCLQSVKRSPPTKRANVMHHHANLFLRDLRNFPRPRETCPSMPRRNREPGRPLATRQGAIAAPAPAI